VPKMTLPSKWLKPTNTEVYRQRFELSHGTSDCEMATRVSVPFTEGRYCGGGERPNTELAHNSPLASRRTQMIGNVVE
jgi:hypothetical protein